jgi:hypothetical protein
MKRFASRLLASPLLAALLFAAGCTSYDLAAPTLPVAPFAAPPADRAQICVIRASVMAMAVTFPVHDGGMLVGATRGPGFFCYAAAPGRHVIATEADETEVAALIAAPGGRYYLKQEVDNILGYVKCRAIWVTEPVARELLEDVAPGVLVGVPGEERLPGEAPFAPAL